jgi:uncharacterized protein (TIGR00299 family) protein
MPPMSQSLHVHLDAVGGAAGDMFAAAMLDARPDLHPRVFADLAAVIPAEFGTPTLTEGLSGGIAARRFGLVDSRVAAAQHGHGTSFADLAQRIASAALQPGTAEQAMGILRRLAECESRLHRVPLRDVHFHELGGWDSLLDVVAAGSIAAALGPCTWSVSDLPRGNGMVRTQHGWLPVPAPATVELLRDFRWRDDSVGGERVTPTGAAILAHLVNTGSPPAEGLVLQTVGVGAGTRELAHMPNILRALVFATDASMPALRGYRDDVIVLSFDVDDMTGEEVGVAADRLRATEGVLDLSIGNRQGKKSRPIVDFRLLIRPQALAAVSRLCFEETSTIGLRWRREQRICLERSTEALDVEGTALNRKRSALPDGSLVFKVDSDDLTRFDGLIRRRKVKFRGEQRTEDS